MSLKIYYFGFIEEYGHGWLEPKPFYSMNKIKQENFPWKDYEIDGKLCINDSKEYQPQGRCLMRSKFWDGVGNRNQDHRETWTLCTFWDRSGDSRLGCNTAFMVNKLVCFNEMMQLAKDRFPEQMKRIENSFTLKLEKWV